MGRDVIAPHEFSVGALEGWHGVLLGLFGSAVLLLSGRQDLNKARRQKLETPFGLLAFFWFSLALFSAGAVVWLGVGARMWGGALLGPTLFCLEVWVLRHWWGKARSI